MRRKSTWLVASAVTVLALSIFFGTEICAQEAEEKKEEPKKLLTLPIEEVVVVGARGERKLLSLSESVSVISRSDIEASQAVTADELLKTVPGIDVQGAGEYGDKVTLNIRGLQGRYGAQRVLVLIDGRPANEEYMGDFDFRFAPLEAVERIEVGKGPASALYGGLAIGGVINIITKDPRKEKAENLTASLGSYNSNRFAATVTTGRSPLAGLFSGHVSDTDGYLKNSDGSNRDWENGQAFAKVVQTLRENSALTFSTGTAYGTGNEEDFHFHQRNEFQYLTFETTTSKHSENKLEVRAYRNGMFRELEWNFGGDARYHQYTAGAQAQFTFKPWAITTVTSGLEVKTQRANVGEVTGRVKEQITDSACYVQKEIAAGMFNFTLGIRLDLTEEFGSEVSPRMGITCEPVKSTVFRLCGGKAFHAPAISDLFMPPVTYGTPLKTYESNPDLEPETLLSGEFGLRQDITLRGKKRFSIDAVVYRSRGEDFWDYMEVLSGPPPTLKAMNVNAVNIFGGELEVAAILSPSLKVSLGYAYTDARYATYKPDPTIERNHVEDIPQHSGSAALSYRSYEGHTGSIALRVVGDRYTDPENYIANKLHSFTVLQVGGSAKISDHARAFARIDNVTDKKYRELVGQIQPGRAFTVGLSLDF